MSINPLTTDAFGDSAGADVRAPVRGRAWMVSLRLILLVVIVRLVYLAWFCPYELIGDESYYWEEARHLGLCYNEKGPGLAWMIAGSCKLLGDTVFAVRVPVLLSFIVAAWGVGRLAIAATHGSDDHQQRSGLLAVLCFLLMPAFVANGQISTQDGVLIALWVALSGIGLRLVRRWREDSNTWWEWLSLWAVLGAGALFKHTVILFMPGLVIYAWIERRHLSWRFGQLAAQQLIGVFVFTLLVSPMIYWNARHGWPMVAHSAGHLGVGGDQAGRINPGNPLIWLASTLAGILGAFGPGALIMMIWACIAAWKHRRESPEQWTDQLWFMCAAWPHVAFFVALSFVKPIVPSWPLVSFAPLMVLMAQLGSQHQRQKTKQFDWVWTTTLVYGIGAWVIVSYPTFLARLPLVGKVAAHAINPRITGHRAAAADLQHVLDSVAASEGKPPLLVARHYMTAGIDCFYLRGHPVVFTAGKYLGKRSTTFDQWDDTRLDNPALHGRTLLLIGEGDVPWDKALTFDICQPIAGHAGKYFLATNYQGPKPDHPKVVAGND